MKNRKTELILLLLLVCGTLPAQQTGWPEIRTEARPGARWWWMGSAVDTENLTWNLEEYASKGLGTVEITPIYGVQGNDANDISFLSPRWMEVYKHTIAETDRLNMATDMNTGTGWPFGGPEVSLEDAATKLITRQYRVQGGKKPDILIKVEDEKNKPYATLNRVIAYGPKGKIIEITDKVTDEGEINWKVPKGEWTLIAAFNGKTRQQVKRAAPGGVGYVMDHLSKEAVSNYLSRFEKAFETSGAPYPRYFFNDSYEVYGADWTPDFFEQFEARRGYKLENHLPEFLSEDAANETTRRIISDYRETMGELLLENFTRQWTAWAHKHGSKTRNQAHGSPGNLIDIYATVDIPECEGFGLSEFGIKGLRNDTLNRKNDSDLSMLKYASSGAHIAGKRFTSSETFTWLTEHFRTSLSQAKPDLDLMFVSGVNYIFFHGITYSPRQAAWPGWKFYASVDMSPTNTIWRDAGPFFDYISRSQSFLQMGEPDNDFLVYLPVYDMLSKEDKGRLLLFDIHGMEKRAPKFIETIHTINESGYDVDYISDNFIRTTQCVDGLLQTSGGTRYKAIIAPGVELIPEDVLEHLLELAEAGAQLVFTENYPEDVPGFARLEERRTRLQALKSRLPETHFGETLVSEFGKGKIITGNDYAKTLAATGVAPEEMKTTYGLSAIRRNNPDGHHYFISSLQPDDVDAWITLAVPARSAMFFDPMTGKTGKAQVRTTDGKTAVRIDLRSGESLILKTFGQADVDVTPWNYWKEEGSPVTLSEGWKLSFVESDPEIEGEFEIGTPGSWTELDIPEAKVNKGTALYTTVFELPAGVSDNWILDLGDVRESARVRINGKEAGILYAVPYRTEVGAYLQPGTNTLKIEVTNLPANRIADYDRRDIEWRIFKEINIVDNRYQVTKYGNWEPVESGLSGKVQLIPVTKE
ncbi:MAG: glycosyl hydrolase family 2 [Bacteroides sp.]|nr:glycosyl hydrolase family 2 [Bacteroides sp.]